jgi:hypothetical protein
MPDLDIVRIQDVGLQGAEDPNILEWAAQEGRVLLTHDVATMGDFAYERILKNQPMPGVLAVIRSIPIGLAIEGIILVVECSFEAEWEGQVRYLPV